jgi:hypothetical protein
MVAVGMAQRTMAYRAPGTVAPKSVAALLSHDFPEMG